MYRDSYRHRKKYYITIFASIYVVIFAICALTIALNWKFVKMLFTPREQQISLEQSQFNDLFSKVKYLEDLSKEYDEQNYQIRAVIYIRSGSSQYDDATWGHLLGYNDANFVSFVEEKQGDKKISTLRSLGGDFRFTNPQTKQKVDFYRLFANLNALMVQNQQAVDCIGLGGYICSNAILHKDSLSTSLKDDIKLNMMSSEWYGDYMRFADYDAVNIYDMIANNKLAYKSVYVSVLLYYATMDKQYQTNNFIKLNGFEEPTQVAVYQIYTRLQNNFELQSLCDMVGFDYPDVNENEDETFQATVYLSAIRAYVEILGI